MSVRSTARTASLEHYLTESKLEKSGKDNWSPVFPVFHIVLSPYFVQAHAHIK